MLIFLTETALPFGLRLAPQKCQLICFHRPGTVNKNMLPVVKLGEKIIPWKSSVIYLGSLFTDDGNSLAAVKHRICCAETIVKRLNPRVFRRRAVNNRLKGKFVGSAVIASLLYGLHHCYTACSTVHLVSESNDAWMDISFVLPSVLCVCHTTSTCHTRLQRNVWV